MRVRLAGRGGRVRLEGGSGRQLAVLGCVDLPTVRLLTRYFLSVLRVLALSPLRLVLSVDGAPRLAFLLWRTHPAGNGLVVIDLELVSMRADPGDTGLYTDVTPSPAELSALWDKGREETAAARAAAGLPPLT